MYSLASAHQHQLQQTRLHAGRKFLPTVHHLLRESLLPYWPCLTWTSSMAFLKRAGEYLPCLPYSLPQHLLTHMLNAVNLICPYLPRTVLLTALDLARASYARWVGGWVAGCGVEDDEMDAGRLVRFWGHQNNLKTI